MIHWKVVLLINGTMLWDIKLTTYWPVLFVSYTPKKCKSRPRCNNFYWPVLFHPKIHTHTSFDVKRHARLSRVQAESTRFINMLSYVFTHPYPLVPHCPKCGIKDGRYSCCFGGGSWFLKCGHPPKEFSWLDGIMACKGGKATRNLCSYASMLLK